jgi:hypothetical protein
MAIFGIGAMYEGTDDVSRNFIQHDVAGIGLPVSDAPELHQLIKTLKVGDIIYIKSFSPSSAFIFVKAIGVIRDEIIVTRQLNNLVQIGRNVRWLVTNEFQIPKPKEKNNVRLNSVYVEFHPAVQAEIIQRLP